MEEGRLTYLLGLLFEVSIVFGVVKVDEMVLW